MPRPLISFGQIFHVTQRQREAFKLAKGVDWTITYYFPGQQTKRRIWVTAEEAAQFCASHRIAMPDELKRIPVLDVAW